MEPEEIKKITDIDGSESWTDIQPLESAGDIYEKQYKFTCDGESFLLRIKPIDFFEEMREHAVFADRIYNEAKVYTPKPVEMGACNDEQNAYAVYKWLDGDSLDEIIMGLPTPVQFSYGKDAGKMLKNLHDITPVEEFPDWKATGMKLFDEKVENFRDSGIYFKGAEKALAYLDSHRFMLENRPLSALHGSFCCKNLFLDKSFALGIKNLDGFDYGDPYSDFYCIQDNISCPFMKGQIKGYFGSNIPTDFFELMALYIALDALTTVTRSFGNEEEKHLAVARAEKTVVDFDGFSNVIPGWY